MQRLQATGFTSVKTLKSLLNLIICMVEYSEAIIRLLAAFLIIILGLIIGNIVKNVTKRILKGAELNRVIEEQLKVKWNLEKHISNIAKYLVYTIMFIIFLDILGIPTKILWAVFIVVLIAVVLFIFLAFKDWLPNLVSGIYILRTKKIKKNDIIETRGIRGKVIEINLLETKIETNNNEIISIPNHNLTKYEVVSTRK